MIGVQDEDAVHRLGEDRIDDIVLGRHGEAHAQEVFRIAEIVARMDERLADAVFEGARRDRRHLGDQAVGRDLALLQVVDVEAVVVKGRQGADGAGHHRHRVGIAAETVEKAVELRVQHGVMGDGLFEFLELRGFRQFTVQQQVANLEEARLFSQLADRIAAVQQHAGVAVDIGDLAFARGGRGETRVVGEGVGFRIQLADIDDVGPDRPALDRQVDGLVAQG